MKRLLSSLLLVALNGLGCAGDSAPTATPLSRLQTAWRSDLFKREAFQPHNGRLAQQLFERERVFVRESTGTEAFALIDGSLRPSERALILLGDLQQLRRQPKLTEIYHPGTMEFSGFSAYLAPDGKLLFLWIMPAE